MATWRIIKRAERLIQCQCMHIVTAQQILTLCVYICTKAVCVHTELSLIQFFLMYSICGRYVCICKFMHLYMCNACLDDIEKIIQ